MKALADFIVSGRFQAFLVAALSGILAFLAPPWSTLLVYLGAASIALVTLRISPSKGLQVLVVATLLTGLFYQLAGVSAAAIAITLLMMWLPCSRYICAGRRLQWQNTGSQAVNINNQISGGVLNRLHTMYFRLFKKGIKGILKQVRLPVHTWNSLLAGAGCFC